MSGVGLLLVLLAAPSSAAAGDPVPVPVPVVEGIATIAPEDVVADPVTGLGHVRLAFPDRPPPRLLLDRRRRDAPADRLLAEVLRRGAAGNHGDLYDNRDRGHSALSDPPLPTLSRTVWTEAARARGLDYAVNPGIVFGATTIGNSSTAMTGGPGWRSLARHGLTDPVLPLRWQGLYAANHLYVYPEHRDHDPERGDLFPAASPHVLVSQGSSGSDRPLLMALAYALAALRPDTKAFLREKGLVAPTLQMLLRRSLDGVESDADYLSPRAHPSAFEGGAVALTRLIARAAALTPAAVPPAVRLRVVAEPEEIGPVFGDALSERLFDTDDAAARVARGLAAVRVYRLSVAGTADPVSGGERQPLRFHWRVLRGPGVRVTPLDAAGTGALVEVPWTEPYPVPGRADLDTYRIDVAVFADNGAELSAPAFFSVAFPPTERRVHDPDGRLLEVAFDPPDLAGRYADPRLFPWRGWRDVFARDDAGRLTGWERIAPRGAAERFTAHGHRVLETDAAGRATLAEAVRYDLRPASERERDGRPRVQVEAAGPRFLYRYAGPADRVGRPEPIP